MRMSQYFLPTLKENPAEAQIVSHRLMLRAGMIRQTSRRHLCLAAARPARAEARSSGSCARSRTRAGAQEVLMPTIQPAELWRESGRYDDYGKEMLRIRDRHEREMLYGPTNEEMITDLSASASRATATCRRTSITSSGSSATRCGRASA